MQELSDKGKLTKRATLTLLQDTDWPPESKEAARKLVQTIQILYDLHQDISLVQGSAKEFIRVLEAVHTSLESVEHSEIPSGLRNQPATLQFDVSRAPESSDSSGLQQKTVGRPATDALPTSRRLGASTQVSPPGLPDDHENLNSILDAVLRVARKAFKTVEAVSETIPVVGDFVGVAAEVGMAFAKMIDTMDKNKDVAKELASRTSKLSTYLEHIKTTSNAEDGNELAAHILDLQRELERVQNKVNRWSSLGHFKKAFSASEHAEELKLHQDAVQNALEEMQRVVSVKTSDLVEELKDSKLRAERRRLRSCLGDGTHGARGSSIEDIVCLPGTRVEILDRIDQWINDTSTSAERVLWIRGTAGRGKSTIASTVAHSWGSKGACAIFHFRRGHNASDGQFICALARQLGESLVPEVKNAILACVEENEDIAKERLDEQFKTLLVGSLGKLQDYAPPIIIIVDALDECENVAEAVRFVQLIDQHSSSLLSNVKFLLTCRPEAPLLVELEQRRWQAEDLESIPDAFEDITRFIQHSFAQIREGYDLPANWASPAHVEGMVKMSQGLFQWARTAITYIGERAPVQRLQELLQHSSTWGQLDHLYRQILTKAFDEAAKHSMREQLLSWVLETLVVAPYPVSLEVIAFLHADHEIFEGQEDAVQFLRNDLLADLKSLLHIPQSLSEPLRLMHTSIRDLLVTRELCDPHYLVEPVQAHHRLASISLWTMKRNLRKNICGLFDISKANTEVQDVVESRVPKGLQYCCRSWPIHLTTGITRSETNGAAANDVLSNFRMISEEKLLAWLEVMSLIGATHEALTIAKQVHQWLEKWPSEMSGSDLTSLWDDTRRFIASSLEPISFGALHIYASALPHCPLDTKLWAKYGGHVTTRILHGKRQRSWPANIWTSSLGSRVSDIVFSPDGEVLACNLAYGTVRVLDTRTGASVDNPPTSCAEWITSIASSLDSKVQASVFYDNTVRLRDARTGAQMGDLVTGHTEPITSVVVSPDGKVLACVSADKTIQLWNTRTRAQIGDPLTGHTESITSVVFSRDGEVLASGSFDKTVRLWDARTGAQLTDPLTSHTQPITFVIFSLDGKVLASVSFDQTIRLWDTRTGAQMGDPLTGHTHPITFIVFSPDGEALASVSFDKTVRLWNARTGTQLADPLIGHTESITFVVFSSDSKALASVSADKTVQLWDARTGARLGDPLTGHTESITFVVFSPDSKVLASGSFDKTVRLWDARTGAQLADPLTRSTELITSIVFSPDGKVLASRSSDVRTIQLWDARTGAQLGNPLTGHTESITSVAFSPDSKVLVSGSGDKTIQLWDAQTGAQLGDPLTGHTESIRSVVFPPNGEVLASVSADKTVRLWDARTGAQLGDPLTGHTGSITSVVFSPNGKVLASGSADKTVRLWDAGTGAQMGDPLIGHTQWITFVVFSPDGELLASGSFDKTIRLWDARTGAQLGDPLTGHTEPITSVVFSPDSKALASLSFDKTVRLWDALTGAQMTDPLTSRSQWITSVVFSPDSKVLAPRSDDGTVRLWDVRTGAQLSSLLTGHMEGIASVTFSLDGKVLASKALNGTAQRWDSLTCQTHTGSLKIFAVDDLTFKSNWIFCGSKRLLWLPVHYQSMYSPTILFSQGRLALLSSGILSIIDVSEFSKS